MTTPRHVRTAAARLTGSEEERTGAVSLFRVDGTEYAALDAGHVTFWLAATEAQRRRDDIPGVEEVVSGSGVAGLRWTLADVNGMQVNALLTAAWEVHAPAALRPVVEPPTVRDLPTSIGRPATRALAAAGVHTLTGVAAMTRGEVAALHGVGPKAVGLLAAALQERGTAWE